ncbi:MAG: Gfo/Idh/MocA family oxidoreductase [Clostridiales bacterium]|nr:Gfo/Idh/MocA family oxidoreductase [Clostridiales bacterium]
MAAENEKSAINVAVIGCGGISNVHMRALGSVPYAKVVALCDVQKDRALSHMEKYGCAGAVAYGDYREAIAREDVDLVDIVTPHSAHARMAIDALNAGKYVLCEKPMATRKEDALAMIAADARRRLGIVFQNRYNQSARECKRLIESGALGKVRAVKANVTWHRGEDYYASDAWRGTWSQEGGGTLINQSIHTIDLLYCLCGPFHSIKGAISRDLLADAIEVEDNAHAVIKFESGVVGLLHASNNYGADDPPRITIHCEKGVLELFGDTLWRVDGDDVEVLVRRKPVTTGAKAVYGNSHETLIADFCACARSGGSFWLDGREGYHAIWAVLSIYESSLSNRWVRYEQPPAARP